MKISILCSSDTHPVNETLFAWMETNQDHETILLRRRDELPGGDILFLISCSEIVRAIDRKKYKKTLVIHASDLPRGRGWSPHIWTILGGASEITVSLLEADDKVDSGDIWKKIRVTVPNHALYEELNNVLFSAETSLMDFAVANFSKICPEQQNSDIAPTYFPRRSPEDSELDTEKSIKEQFNLMRVCDPLRFPPFFYLHGHKYRIKLEKFDDE